MPKVRLFHGKVKAIITLSACLSTPAWADDVVVTANRVETEAAQLGSAVTVITAEEIERKPLRAYLSIITAPQKVAAAYRYTNPLGVIVQEMTLKEKGSD